MGGNRARLHATDNRRQTALAPKQQAPEQEYRQQKVGYRSGDNNSHSLPYGFAGEGLMQLVSRHLALALIKHFDVAAQGNSGQRKFGAVTVPPAEQHFAKANREAQDFNATAPGHIKVTKLMHGHQYHQSHDEPQNCLHYSHGLPLTCADQLLRQPAGLQIGGLDNIQGIRFSKRQLLQHSINNFSNTRKWKLAL